MVDVEYAEQSPPKNDRERKKKVRILKCQFFSKLGSKQGEQGQQHSFKKKSSQNTQKDQNSFANWIDSINNTRPPDKMITRSLKRKALQDNQSNSSVVDGVADGEGSSPGSAKQPERRKSIRLARTATSTASTSTVTVSTSGGRGIGGMATHHVSPVALQALLPRLYAWNLPAPTKEQLIEKKRIHNENLAIARQQAENRQVPTQRMVRVAYESEMSSRINLSGKGTYENNPAKTRSFREARDVVADLKAERAASISVMASKKYDIILERLFTNPRQFPFIPNPQWKFENTPEPKPGFSPIYRPFNLIAGERRPTAKSLLLEYTIGECIGCGSTSPVTNNNSHLNGDNKTRSVKYSGSVSDNVQTIAAVKLEKPKMKIECGNCHQKATAVERRRTKTPYDELAGSPTHQMQRDMLYARINELKEMSGCAICHMRDPDCLLIDHSNRWKKRWSICDMITLERSDWIDILEEIENGECCVMCHNCHTIKGFVEGESC